MINNINLAISVEYEDVYLSDKYNTPNKNLLAAVLERAVMDLFIKDEDKDNLKYKNQAINWFLHPSITFNNGFSFSQIMQHLGISSKTGNKLMTLAKSIQVKNGKHYDLYSRYRSRGYRRLRNSK